MRHFRLNRLEGTRFQLAPCAGSRMSGRRIFDLGPIHALRRRRACRCERDPPGRDWSPNEPCTDDADYAENAGRQIHPPDWPSILGRHSHDRHAGQSTSVCSAVKRDHRNSTRRLAENRSESLRWAPKLAAPPSGHARNLACVAICTISMAPLSPRAELCTLAAFYLRRHQLDNRFR